MHTHYKVICYGRNVRLMIVVRLGDYIHYKLQYTIHSRLRQTDDRQNITTIAELCNAVATFVLKLSFCDITMYHQ